jgi:hypothetical protein
VNHIGGTIKRILTKVVQSDHNRLFPRLVQGYQNARIHGGVLMKQPLSILCLLFSIGFCGLVLRFPSPALRAEERPVSSATPAATAAISMSPTATPTPAVLWVGVYDSTGAKRKAPKAYAGRGDEIWVDVINYKNWQKSLLEDKKFEKLNPNDLILYLNHVALKGVHPFYWYDWMYQEWTGNLVSEFPVRTFGFSLVRNEDSKSAWSHLLNKPDSIARWSCRWDSKIARKSIRS